MEIGTSDMLGYEQTHEAYKYWYDIKVDRLWISGGTERIRWNPCKEKQTRKDDGGEARGWEKHLTQWVKVDQIFCNICTLKYSKH